MNKTKLYITSLFLAAAILNVGCMSTVSNTFDSAKRSLSFEKQPESIALYSQVKDEDKVMVTELDHEVAVTKELKTLAALEEQHDKIQRERSETNNDMLELLVKEKQYRVQVAKLEAVDRNQLGDKITNIESIAETHVDALKVQQKRLKLESEVAIMDVKLSKLKEQINVQKEKIERIRREPTGNRNDKTSSNT